MVHPREIGLALAAAMTTVILAGCGGADTPAVCSSMDALKSSIADLQDVKIDRDALATLQDDLEQVQSALGKVKSDAEAQFGDEVDAVEQAASTVTSSLESATSAPSAQTVLAVGTAVKAMGTALSDLGASLKTTC